MKLNVVPARTGLLWIRQGVRTFFRQPLAMGGLFFMFMGTVSLLSAVPLIGPALALALVPAATLGLMAAAREAEAGRFPMPLTLVTAFRAGPQRSKAMLGLGAAYAAALLLIMLLATLLGGDAQPPAPAGEVTPEVVRAALAGGEIWWLMLLYLPVMAAFWHAPALLHWHGVSPVKALFFSLLACWANKGAMLLYMAGWVGVFAAMGLALSLLAGLLGSATALQVALYPLVLLMASMFHTSIWFTFRDSFIGDEVAPTTTGETP